MVRRDGLAMRDAYTERHCERVNVGWLVGEGRGVLRGVGIGLLAGDITGYLTYLVPIADCG